MAKVYKNEFIWLGGVVLVLCCAGVCLWYALTKPVLRLRAAAQAAPYAKENADRQAKERLSRGTPGLAVEGKIVCSEGFGFADLQERVPVWPTTKFRIGSISKPLTATALMQLVEAGNWIWTRRNRNTFLHFRTKVLPLP